MVRFYRQPAQLRSSDFFRQTEIALGNLERIYKRIGNTIDVLFLCGTDFGTQTSAFCSVKTFHELSSPYQCLKDKRGLACWPDGSREAALANLKKLRGAGGQETCYTSSIRRRCSAVPGEEIDRLRSLLASAHEPEKVTPFPAQDPSRTSYAASADEIERLRSLFAHAYDSKVNRFRRLVLWITKKSTPPIEQPIPHPGKNKSAA